MLRQGAGSIITIASVAGLRGGLASPIYSGSKAAASQLTRSAAAELSHAGIRLNCISPGGIVTGILAKAAGVSGADADRVLGVIRNRFASVQPIPRAGETDDVAQAAVFLASDASSFITGQDSRGRRHGALRQLWLARVGWPPSGREPSGQRGDCEGFLKC
jgi:NAD(P)-dependent dehydrogenase (short-subunit alcohol dehydrogenase family)